MRSYLMALAAGALATTAAIAETPPDEVEFDGLEVAEPLTDTPGDPERGRQWFMGRKLGNCLACHQNEDMADQPFHGEVGPPVTGAGQRWSEGQLRAIVINSKNIFGDQTIMPAFYRAEDYNRPREQFAGKTILTAQQVEDVVAYLKTLK